MQKQIQSIIRMYLDKGLKVTAFSEAARWGLVGMLRELLASGIPVDAKADNGATALMMAASGGQVEAIRFLVANGADVNAKNPQSGYNPLMYALASTHKIEKYRAIVEILLDAGSDPNHRDNTGLSVIEYASKNHSKELCTLLQSKVDTI